MTDASSIHSDEDNYDDVKSTVANYQSARSQHYDQYRPAISPGGPSNPISPSGELFFLFFLILLLNNNQIEGGTNYMRRVFFVQVLVSVAL